MSNAPPITTRETVESLAQKRLADSLAERRPVKKPQKMSHMYQMRRDNVLQ